MKRPLADFLVSLGVDATTEGVGAGAGGGDGGGGRDGMGAGGELAVGDGVLLEEGRQCGAVGRTCAHWPSDGAEHESAMDWWAGLCKAWYGGLLAGGPRAGRAEAERFVFEYGFSSASGVVGARP